jgi:hypothetical protein
MGMKWTAFLRLRGETWTKKGEEMRDEFEGLVQVLRGVDVDYDLIVFAGDPGSTRLGAQSSAQTSDTWVHRAGSSA